MSEARIIEEEILEEDQDELETAAVLDDASAVMMLEKIREANEQYEKMESWYRFQLDKAKQIRDRTIAWAELSLRGYFDMVPTKDSKTQRKYELPGGTLILKAQQPKYEVNDAELVPWLKENGAAEYIKVKESADWANLKKQVQLTPDGTAVATEDGEIIPGITVEKRDPVFQVIVK